ncbi:MAG: hypothetical protein GY943_38230 [Chloroflexi bacterium]|nr:hypothetical protein [Chloroflexota bacterium]
MKLNRILIVENNLLMGAVIEELLSQDKDLELYSIVPENETNLVAKVWQLCPDVIILNEDSELIEPINLLTSLINYPQIRLVVVSLYHDRVLVYDQQKTSLKQHYDLTAVIR